MVQGFQLLAEQGWIEVFSEPGVFRQKVRSDRIWVKNWG